MTLKEYIATLTVIEKEHPDLILVYSSDSEGNSFEEVYYSPTIGKFEDGEFRTYTGEEGEDEEDYVDLSDVNAVCLN